LVVGHQPGQASFGQGRKAVFGRGVVEGVLAVAIDQREVHVYAAPGHPDEGLAQKREVQAVGQGHFPGQHPEQEGLVGRLEGVVVFQR